MDTGGKKDLCLLCIYVYIHTQASIPIYIHESLKQNKKNSGIA